MNNSSVVSSNSQNKEVQRDLDQVCLKAIVTILHGLPLQSTEIQTRDTDRNLSKSRLFQKYFTFFTQLLDRCHRYEVIFVYSFLFIATFILIPAYRRRQIQLHDLVLAC